MYVSLREAKFGYSKSTRYRCHNFAYRLVIIKSLARAVSMFEQLFVLHKLELISDSIIDNLKNAVDLITFEQEDIQFKAEKIAALIYKKTPVIYTTDRSESMGLRCRQQFNENSKILCWHNVIPAMNHNELEGWKTKHEDIAVIFEGLKTILKELKSELTSPNKWLINMPPL